MAERVPVAALVIAVAVAVVAVLVLAPQPAQAQANGVWIDCRHNNALCTKDFSQVISVWESMGAIVTVTTEMDYNQLTSGDYRLLVIMLPTPGAPGECEIYGDYLSPFCDQEIEMLLPFFLSLGGRLVLLADNESDDPAVITDEAAGNNGIRQILDSLAPNLVLNIDRINSDCGSTTDIVGDPLTVGLTSWNLAQVNTVTGGDPLIQFTRSDGGGTATLAAVERLPSGGEIVLFGDVEGFLGTCLNAANQTPFWQNLYGDQSAAVDNDGDGFLSDEDCNDTDATIFPGAVEDCDNLVDDDCDGAIDGADSDCPGDDDDATAGDDDTGSDDDDTGFGDDDTGGSFGDDDDDSYANGDWGGGCCGTTYARDEQAPTGLMLLVLGLGFLRSRWRGL